MKTLKHYFKTRNWTRKSKTEFRENIQKYLTPEECAALPVRNELLTFQPNHRNEHAPKKMRELLCENKVDVSKTMMRELSREIRKESHPHFFVFEEGIHGHKDRLTGYPVLTEDACEPHKVLDLSKWAKRFPYFHVSTQEISPSGDRWLLSIDFLGSQTYHLFTKSIYADDYRQIQIPQQRRLQTHQLFSNARGNERTSSEQAAWLDDTRVLYVSTNRYYNDSGLYLYDLETQKHKRLFKGKPGMFLRFETVASDLFLVLSLSDYNSEEIHLLDLDTFQSKIMFPRVFSVLYPYINHEKGRWIVCKREKGRDTIATTSDFKKWNILYQNENPWEQIMEVLYDKERILFTLETLKGMCLYGIHCGKVKLLERSFDSYRLTTIRNQDMIVHKCKYTSPYQILKVGPTMELRANLSLSKTSRYKEEVAWVHPKLRVTLLYKPGRKRGPCLLRGYGAYNTYEHSTESPYYYPLLERGFVVAIAHLRGGGEYGYKGYDEGRMTHKKNTFQDFIDTAHFLIKEWTTRDQLAIWGRSCGGLLISSVINQEPDLCKVALVGVPFVTPLETMRSYKTPLGLETRSELGDVSQKKVRDYIHSYAPLEHVRKDGKYPHLLIYTNLNDTLVPYKEPLAYYHALKEVDVYSTGKSDLSFYLDARFGHFQGSLLKDRCDHYAMLFAYVLKHLDLV